MKRSDYPTVLRRGIAGMVILLLLFGAFAPAAMAQPWVWPNCNWQCTAGDFQVNRTWLGNCTTGAELEPCVPGSNVTACIWAEFYNGAGTERYTLMILGELWIDGNYLPPLIDECALDSIPGKNTSNASLYQFNWTCGQKVELKNVTIPWDTKQNTCENVSRNCTKWAPAQCHGPNAYIIVEAPLVANFTSNSPQCFCTNITFNGTATGGNTTVPYTYSWDFDNDGAEDSLEQNPSYHYGAPGTYTVNLTVTDCDGTTDNESKTVTVHPTPVANFTTNSPQIYCYNITFNDTTTGGTLPYNNWSWDFDDGTNSTEQNTSHRYSAPGTYNVTLNVTDANGCTNSTTKQVIASDYTASLAITKSANVSSATVGTVIGYNITVNNTGNVNLSNVTVTDNLTGLSQTIPTLVPNASQTFNPSYTVTQADICAPINNTATANGTDPCGGSVGPVNASVSVPTTFSPGLAITKSANVSSATVGTVIGYNITVNNTGNVNLSNVTVTDNLTGLSQTIPTLVPNASQTFNPSYTVTQADICAPINNTATANGTDPCGGSVGPVNASVSVPTTFSPSLAITKTANVSTATVGDIIKYWYNVTNTGNVNLTSLTVIDSRLGAISMSPTALAPNDVARGTKNYTVRQADVCADIVNNATANATDPCSQYKENISADVTVTTPYTADLMITKEANVSSATVGDVIKYWYNVTNTGNVNLTSLTVTDSRLGAISMSPTTLAPNDVARGTETYTVTQSDICGPINNTATANGTDPCAMPVGPVNTSFSMNPTYNADLSIVKTASLIGTCPGSDPLAVSIGDTVTYCYNVTNTGNVDLTNVTVNDDIYGSVTLGTTTLAPGETTGGTVTHVVVEPDAPSVTNIATATGTDPCSVTVTDTDPCTINVALAPGIEVVKTASLTGTCPGSDPLAVSIGDTVTYCYNVTNTGDVNLTGVTVNDDIYGPVTLGKTTLAPGESTGGTLTHVVVESDAPSVIDIATATGTPPVGAEVTDTDDCTINVAIAPAIELEKTVWNETLHSWVEHVNVSLNDTVRFKLWIHNNGTCNLTNINVTDILPASLGRADAAVPAENGTSMDNGTIWWNLTGTLNTSESRTIEFNATALECGVMGINNANVSGYCPNTSTYVYDNDTASVEAIHKEAPKIISVRQSTNSPLPGENVTITAHVTGSIRVISVNLTYDTTTVPMTLVSGTATDGYWNATIPGQPAGTTLTIYVTARDDDGNSVSSTPHDKHWTLPPVPVPAINPPGILALVGLLSIIAIRAIRSTHHKRSKQT